MHTGGGRSGVVARVGANEELLLFLSFALPREKQCSQHNTSDVDADVPLGILPLWNASCGFQAH